MILPYSTKIKPRVKITQNFQAHAVVNAEWGQDEQKRLEQALRTYDPKEPERWDKIASAVDTRSKRECMVRFKQLAEMAKAKKLAIAKAKKAAN